MTAHTEDGKDTPPVHCHQDAGRLMMADPNLAQILVKEDWDWRMYEGVYNSMIRRYREHGMEPVSDEPNVVHHLDSGYRIEGYRMRNIVE